MNDQWYSQICDAFSEEIKVYNGMDAHTGPAPRLYVSNRTLERLLEDSAFLNNYSTTDVLSVLLMVYWPNPFQSYVVLVSVYIDDSLPLGRTVLYPPYEY